MIEVERRPLIPENPVRISSPPRTLGEGIRPAARGPQVCSDAISAKHIMHSNAVQARNSWIETEIEKSESIQIHGECPKTLQNDSKVTKLLKAVR